MTDPLDETQPTAVPTAGAVPPPPGPASSPAVDPVTGRPAHPVTGRPPDAAATPGTSATAPPLRANPDRPPSDWREPPWIPPRDKARDRGPSLAAIIVGLVLLAIGIYYFLDRTLGVDVPDIRWGSLWPLILIAIGAVILLRGVMRRR